MLQIGMSYLENNISTIRVDNENLVLERDNNIILYLSYDILLGHVSNIYFNIVYSIILSFIRD